jgi:MYXO-CTERM domain-containing protein
MNGHPRFHPRFSFALQLLAVALALVVPRTARAFCGFYVSGADGKLFNDATQVVLMRDGTRTVLSMQNDYKGPPQDFALVVPVPVVLAKDNVKTLSPEVFKRVDTLSAPRLVEYWEQDPCPQPLRGLAGIGGGGTGQGFGSGHGRLGGASADVQVKVEAQFEVGEYEIVILSAKDASALDTWLRDNKYKIPENAGPALLPYVAAGSKFFVAKVNVAKVKLENGRATLSPLRFHYDTDRFELPVKLGMLNSAGTQDLIVNIIATDRYEVASYANVTIPTNLEVSEAARASFGSFYASLFDRTLQKHPNSVVTEYAWGATSCDPCPGTVQGLSGNDLASLGADVMPNMTASISRSGSAVSIRQGTMTVTGKLPSEVITRIVRQNFGRFRLCYENGLRANPNLTGKVAVQFEIDGTGAVTSQKNGGSDLPDPNVIACIVRGFGNMSFPESEDKKPVSVLYPIILGPGSASPGSSGGAFNVTSTKGPLTLTRLHARYTKDSLGSDLVFRVAGHITGGREQRAADGHLEHGATQSPGGSAFQGRYAIRHPWPNKIACKDPQRGEWGGPWPWLQAKNETKAATKPAYAQRGSLASFTNASAPELDMSLTSAAVEIPAVVAPVVPAPPSSSSSAPASADAGIAARDTPVDAGPTTPAVPPGSHCGCHVVQRTGAPSSAIAALVGLALFVARRRRPRSAG